MDDWWVSGGEGTVELPGHALASFWLYSFEAIYDAIIVLNGPDSMDLRAALEQGIGLYVISGGYNPQFGDERVGSSNGMETISVTGGATSPDVSFATIRAYQKGLITAVALVMDMDGSDKPDLKQGEEILDSIVIERP